MTKEIIQCALLLLLPILKPRIKILLCPWKSLCSQCTKAKTHSLRMEKQKDKDKDKEPSISSLTFRTER